MNRKIGLLALTLALTAALAGCSDPSSSVDPTPSAPAVAPTDSPAPDTTVTPGIVGRGSVDGGMWNDELGRDAADMARGAAEGAGDIARGAADGVGDLFRGVGDAARDVGDGIADAAR